MSATAERDEGVHAFVNAALTGDLAAVRGAILLAGRRHRSKSTYEPSRKDVIEGAAAVWDAAAPFIRQHREYAFEVAERPSAIDDLWTAYKLLKEGGAE